jgi:hypothetical protein
MMWLTQNGQTGVTLAIFFQRRLKASLLQDFEDTLDKSCPEDFGRAFELLQFTQSLVDMYKEVVSKQDKKQTQCVLDLYSPFHSQQHTMKLFECSKHGCEQDNLDHRIRNLSAPQKTFTVTVLTKETVDHMQDFALRADNCQRTVFSDAKIAKFHLVMNRNSLFLKYTDECKRLYVKAMGETTFYS